MSKFNKLYESIMNESINDKNLFKVVFIAGGPGSGKSFIVDKMFSGLGVPLLNSDTAFEYLLTKNKLSHVIDSANVEEYGKQQITRGQAKEITAKQKGFWLDGMLPIIIDGTGRDYVKIKKQKEQLEKLGYDTSMVYVNTTLDVALERNKMRARKVDEKIVKKSWEDVQSNLGKFQSTFKNGFIIVDNSKSLDKRGVDELGIRLYKTAIKFINSKLKNQTGIKVINILKNIGGKYLSDLEK